MLKNYFITAIRNLLAHKLYSSINIGGVAFGLSTLDEAASPWSRGLGLNLGMAFIIGVFLSGFVANAP